jgi:chromosome segregation ATPase
MTPANYISIAALLVSLIMAVVNTVNISKNQKRAENVDSETLERRAREEQAAQTSLMLALNNIEKQLQKIENVINTVQADTRQNHDQLLILEQSLKSVHHRVDEHEQRLNDIEQALRNMHKGAAAQ